MECLNNTSKLNGLRFQVNFMYSLLATNIYLYLSTTCAVSNIQFRGLQQFKVQIRALNLEHNYKI